MKIKKCLFFFVFVLCLAFLSQGVPYQGKMSLDEVRKKIEFKNNKLAELFNTGNAEALSNFIDCEYYKENASLLLPREKLQGKVALKGFWLSLLKRGAKNLTFMTREVIIFPGKQEGEFDDIAFEIGRLSFDIVKGGEVVDDLCEYQLCWRHRVDCEWYIECGNNSCAF